MSVQEGEMELCSVYRHDYIAHSKLCVKKTGMFSGVWPMVQRIVSWARPEVHALRRSKEWKSPRAKAVDDDCLILGFGRDALKVRDEQLKNPDVLCPLDKEYYKRIVKKLESNHPTWKKLYLEKEIDPIPIDHEIQDLKRTEYLTKYCSRELPFMSVNLARRARALQTLRLPDDIYIPDTSHKCFYRPPEREKLIPPKTQSMRPKYDPKLKEELRRIMRQRTGDTQYQITHGLLGDVILKKNPYGPPREEPRYGRWRTPYSYTYWN